MRCGEGARAIFCSFSGAVADLPPKERTLRDVVVTLASSPRVSTWDMSQLRWLRRHVEEALRRGYVRDESARTGYPWHRYEVTDAGRAWLGQELA